MSDNRKLYTIKSNESGVISTSEEVVAIIAGLAVTEVEGVTSMGGNITSDLVAKIGIKSLSKGINVEIFEGEVKVNVIVNIAYGCNIPDISAKIQDRVKTSVESMTGLKVVVVNIRIASVDMSES